MSHEAGLGSAGIFNGVLLIMMANVPLRKRPVFMGLFGGVFAVANACGPLLGGVFTTKVSWRWCFYINLPIGALVVSVLLITIDASGRANTDSLRQQLNKFDRLGTLVFIPGIVCLLLALQWGGNTYSWGNARIIILLTLGSILLILFIVIQFQAGENATVPIRIIKQRSIAAGVWFSFFNPGAMFILMYYLPIWFQAVKGLDAINSGVHTIPLVLALVVANLIAGIFTRITGYYAPMLILSSIVSSIGTGFVTTLKVDSGLPAWLGWQVLFGVGIGLGMQQSNLAAQTCLSREDVPTGMALMFFSQGLGGVVFITIAQVVFSHSLVVRLSYLDIPLLTPDIILHAGATELRRLVPEEYIPEVLDAYNIAIMATFVVATAAACFTSFAAAGMEFINIHKAAGEGGIRGIEHGSGSGEVEEEVTGEVSTWAAMGEERKSRDKGPGAMEQPTLETIKEEREKGSGDSSPVFTVLVGGDNEKEQGAVKVREAKGKEVERGEKLDMREELEIKEKSDG
jgi:MFS family permease